MILLFLSVQSALAASAPVADVKDVKDPSPMESILSEEVILNLKDPFQVPTSFLVKKEAPKSELESFQLKDFKLNGVVTGPKKTRAMVTTPSNKTFFVKVGDRLGLRDGTVTQIHPDAIRIVEYDVDDRGKKIPDVYEIRVSGDFVSLSNRENE